LSCGVERQDIDCTHEDFKTGRIFLDQIVHVVQSLS